MAYDKRTAASISLENFGPIESGTELDLEHLVRAYYPDVLRLAQSLLDDPADAEDAAQETFIAAARSLHTFRGESKVRTWLFGITINISRTALRRRKRRSALQKALEAVRLLQPHRSSPEEQAIRNETRRNLMDAVEALEEKQRVAVVLYYIQGLSVPEIAALLETSANTIYSRLHHARKQLHHLVRHR